MSEQVTFHLYPLDLLIIAFYVMFLVVVGWLSRHESRKGEIEYLLAGRRLTLPAFVATLVSSWYGGILGVGEYSFRYGISNWLVFGVPYYLAAFLFAMFIARVARKSLVTSIPEQLGKAYGNGPALAGGLIVFIMTVPAAYVLMLGELLRMFFGGSLLGWVVVGTLFSTVYVALGGFRSVVRTDIVQFILMYFGFAILLTAAFVKFGGMSFLESNLPETHLTWHGGKSFSGIFVWYIIALTTLIEPSFYQRTYAAKTAGTAKWGILISILFWIGFDFMATFVGLYARAALPADTNPILSYPALANQLLPAGLRGLFLLALLSVIMSTVDSYTFLAAQALGRDLLAKTRKGYGKWMPGHMQLGLLGSAVMAIGIAAWKNSVVDIWHDLGSLGTSMLLLPMLGSFRSSPPFSGGVVLIAIVISGTITLCWTFLGESSFGYPFGWEPIYIGLGSSAVALVVGTLLGRRARRV